MKIVYDGLFALLVEKKIMQKTLIADANLSNDTFQRIRKNEHINTKSVGKICQYLDVTPNDIMKFIYDDNDALEIENRKKQRQIEELEKQLAELKEGDN